MKMKIDVQSVLDNGKWLEIICEYNETEYFLDYEKTTKKWAASLRRGSFELWLIAEETKEVKDLIDYFENKCSKTRLLLITQ
jgi:hypothetical protein